MTENVTTALQVNATSGNGQRLTLSDPRFVTFNISGNGLVTAGTVAIEYQSDPDPDNPDKGQWAPLASIPVPANKTTEYLGGIISGTYRARISTPVTGGTVTVVAVRPEEQQGWSRAQS